MNKKALLSVLLIFFSVLTFAQTPAGKSFYVDYDAWNEGTKPSIYINCGNSSTFNTGYELTMECWLRAYNYGWNRKVLGKMSDALDNGYVLGFEAGHIYTEIFNPLSNEVERTGDGPLPVDSAWIHIASTFQAGGKLINYINGHEVGSVDVPSNPINENDNPFVIGLAPWDFYSYEYFGDIDEVRIWSTVRTEEELKEYMHKSVDITTPGLIAYYNFDDATGISTSDFSGNGNDGTVTNADNDYWSWNDSYAPFGNETLQTMNDIVAAWYGKAADQYNYALTESGLSVVAEIEEKEFKKFVLFGHNGLAGVSSDNKPVNATEEFQRLNREWYVNIGDDMKVQLLFNLDQASDGLTLPTGEPDSLYVLLFRATATDNFQVLYSANDEVSNNLIFDDVPLQNGFYTVGYDVSKLAGNTSISKLTIENVKMYPNPAKEILHISNIENCIISIFNITGQEVLKTISKQKNLSIDLNLKDGIYLVKISDNQSFITKKLIIQ